jgi:putative ABC transport system permease protein
MFKFNLKSLFRGFARNKFYAILNLLGLSIGIATSLIVLMYVQDEATYDKYNLKHDRIYRLECEIGIKGNLDKYAVVPIPLGPAFKENIPEVEEFARFAHLGNTLINYNDNEFFEEDLVYADSSVFKVFSYKLLRGNPETCLTEINTAVFTEKLAHKYFGDEDPMGKIIRMDQGESVKITGIMADLPGNSHLKFEGLVSMATWANNRGSSDFNSMEPKKFWRIDLFAYILLKENSSLDDFDVKANAFYEEHMKELGDKYNLDFKTLHTKLADTHFRKGLGGELPTGNKNNILIFSLMAAFILLIASINYMNMATARSAIRAKEVGIRKVLGAYKGQLINQFLVESVILSFIALLVSLIGVWLFLPDFNNFTGKELSFDISENKIIFSGIFVISIFVGLVSGSYPAFYLSSFRPVIVLKGAISKTGKKGGLLRRILVVVQFFLAIFMIIGALVVSSQLHFLKNKEMGFNKNNLAILSLHNNSLSSKVVSLKKELLSNPNVLSATNTNGIPGRMKLIRMMEIENETGMENKAIIYCKADYDFVKTFGMEIIEGRDFDIEMGQDKLESVIINETAAIDFGWGNNALGKKIHFGFKADGTGGRMLKVIGVVRDFNFKSLHNKIEPFIFFINEDPEYFLCCHINETNKKETLAFMDQKFREFGSVGPFDYKFLEDMQDEMYKDEKKTGGIINSITLLTIFIALLGLLGLSSFIAERKSREIGVRKVLGGSTGSILIMLYKEFALLILISYILAVPIAWWKLEDWLSSNFVYHIDLQWMYFALAGVVAFVVGLGTISFYVIKAAMLNPVDAIKYE